MNGNGSSPSTKELERALDEIFDVVDDTFTQLDEADDAYLIGLLYAFDDLANPNNPEATISRVSSAVHILRERGYVVEGRIGTDELEVRSPDGDVVEPPDPYA